MDHPTLKVGLERKKQALEFFFKNPYQEGSVYSFVNARAFQIFLYSHQFDQFYSYNFRCLQWYNILSGLYQGLLKMTPILHNYTSHNYTSARLLHKGAIRSRAVKSKIKFLNKKWSLKSCFKANCRFHSKGSSRSPEIDKKKILFIYQAKAYFVQIRRNLISWL